MLVQISVKTGLYLGPWANVVIDLRVEMSLHDIFLLVPIVCTCPVAWGIGDLHRTAAVEEEPCPSAVGSMSPGVVELVEEGGFDRFRRFVSVDYFPFLSFASANVKTGNHLGLWLWVDVKIIFIKHQCILLFF